jgi:hypothetical protein
LHPIPSLKAPLNKLHLPEKVVKALPIKKNSSRKEDAIYNTPTQNLPTFWVGANTPLYDIGP